MYSIEKFQELMSEVDGFNMEFNGDPVFLSGEQLINFLLQIKNDPVFGLEWAQRDRQRYGDLYQMVYRIVVEYSDDLVFSGWIYIKFHTADNTVRAILTDGTSARDISQLIRLIREEIYTVVKAIVRFCKVE